MLHRKKNIDAVFPVVLILVENSVIELYRGNVGQDWIESCQTESEKTNSSAKEK